MEVDPIDMTEEEWDAGVISSEIAEIRGVCIAENHLGPVSDNGRCGNCSRTVAR
jgi:hypothetical protein